MSELVNAVLSFVEKEQRDKIERIPRLAPEGRAQKEELAADAALLRLGCSHDLVFAAFEFLDHLSEPQKSLLRAIAAERALWAIQAEQREFWVLERLSPDERRRFLEIRAARMSDALDENWAASLASLWPDFTADERAWVWPRALAAARASGEETRPWHIADLASIAPAELRPPLLDEALRAWEQRAEISAYPIFYILRPSDDAALHRRLAALIKKAKPGIYLPFLWESVASRAPEGERGWLLHEALKAYEAHGLIEFDIGATPFRDTAALLDLNLAREALSLVLARWDNDMDAPSSAPLLLDRLAELGEPAEPLLVIARRLKTGYLRVEAWRALLPRLPQAMRGSALRELLAWVSAEDEAVINAVEEIVELTLSLPAPERGALLDAIEEAFAARPGLWEAEDAQSILELLAARGERGRAGRFIASIPPDTLNAVAARLALAREADEAARAPLEREARALAESLPGRERDQIWYLIAEHSSWLALDWAQSTMLAWLDEGGSPRDLYRWIPLLLRAGGEEALAKVVRALIVADGLR